MLITKLRAIVAFTIVAFAIVLQATAVVIETSDVLGRPLQYNELDSAPLPGSLTQNLQQAVGGANVACWLAGKYKWMGEDDEDDHPVNGKYSRGYLPSDLGLNTEVEVDENDHDSECRVEHKYAPGRLSDGRLRDC